MLTTGDETRMERERSCFRPIYNFRPEKEPLTAASESANQEVGGGSRRAHETRLRRRRSGRIRHNEEKSHETEVIFHRCCFFLNSWFILRNRFTCFTVKYYTGYRHAT